MSLFKSLLFSNKNNSRSRAPALLFGAALALGMVGQTYAASSDQKPIVFALTTPLSQPGDARSGQAIQKIGNLWVERVNKSGGILGRQVELKAYDTQGKAATGAEVARRAIVQDKASALVGLWSSSVALAEIRVAHRYDVPAMAFYSWDDKVTELNYPQVFRIGPYNSLIARNMKLFVEHQGYKRVAVLAEDTAYGAGFAKLFKKALKGSDIDLDVTTFPAEAQDLTAQLSKIKQFKPDALIIETVYAASNLSIKQAREVGLKTQIVAGWDWPTLSDFWPTVGDAGEGVIYASFKAPDSKLTETGKALKKAYETKYDGETPAIFQYLFVDTLQALKTAIEASGSSDPKKLVEALPNVKFEGTTGEISFTRKKGTVDFNQWDKVSMFFKQLTKKGQTGDQARLVYSSN